MQKKDYTRSTVESAVSSLKSIAGKANLLDTDSVKTYLATASQSEARKEALAIRLARFYRYGGIPFEKPSTQ